MMDLPEMTTVLRECLTPLGVSFYYDDVRLKIVATKTKSIEMDIPSSEEQLRRQLEWVKVHFAYPITGEVIPKFAEIKRKLMDLTRESNIDITEIMDYIRDLDKWLNGLSDKMFNQFKESDEE